jgi:hypothetical protein
VQLLTPLAMRCDGSGLCVGADKDPETPTDKDKGSGESNGESKYKFNVEHKDEGRNNPALGAGGRKKSLLEDMHSKMARSVGQRHDRVE